MHVDADGVPVSVSDRVHRPQRRDPQSVRNALLDLAGEAPGQRQPRHPDDHVHDHPEGDHDAEDRSGNACTGRPSEDAGAHPSDDAGAHPADAPGPYRPPRRLRRLIEARAPRCEFPGCGLRAVNCDAEHDVAWPVGATCACQVGPCCRRHHRVKQEGWTKQRGAGSAVRWTTPTGRQWTSRPQHPAPAPRLRPLRAVPTEPDPWDQLDPVSLERELWQLAGRPDDPAGLELRALDIDPEDPDRPYGWDCPDLLGDRLTTGGTRWSLDLDDPYTWAGVPTAGSDAAEPD